MTTIRTQRGSTLLVALIMLVLLTLIAVSAMSSTTASIQVVGNAQFRDEATAAGLRAIKNVLSNNDFLNKATPPPNQSIDINLDGAADYTVSFDPVPRCISYLEAKSGDPGVPPECTGGAGIGAICYWTLWDITAKVSDVATGTSVIMHQGVRTIAGWMDAANSCDV